MRWVSGIKSLVSFQMQWRQLLGLAPTKAFSVILMSPSLAIVLGDR